MKELRCDCGWTYRGEDEALVEAARQHGRDLHNMEATPEQILAMAVPVADSNQS